ncbi:MAG: epoxyqueuosine reductase [Candidatus Krumholzibacteriia bacterium]|jgi:epoxyqueuosine reductase
MSPRRQNILESTVERSHLAALLASVCPSHHIDLVGAVSLPCEQPHRGRWREWLEAGHHADLEYVTRDPAAREDPLVKNPWARSVLIFAQRYAEGWDQEEPSLTADAPWIERVAKYARGADYHDVFLRDIKQVVKHLTVEIPDFTAFAATDTGPYLEREYAWLAGLGFMGKNSCLIHERLGSGLFLGVALTNLNIDGLPSGHTPQPEPLYAVVPRRRRTATKVLANLCGSCTACIDACPTDALLKGGGLDARSCISTWTIEWQGQAPLERQAEQGGLLFGCDICQAVCPWNHRAIERADGPAVRSEYSPKPEYEQLDLTDLAAISDEEFRKIFRKTPMWRAHPAGMRRNAQVVLKNLDD